MNKRVTILLGIVFCLLVFLFVGRSLGIFERISWLSFLSAQQDEFAPRQIENNVPKIKIKRQAVQGYDALVSEGDTLFAQAAYSEALDLYSQAYKLDSKNTVLFMRLGKTYFALKNYETARKYFENVHEKEPENIEATVWLSKTLIKQNNTSRVFALLTPLENNEEARYLMALLRMLDGDLEKALANLQAVIQLSPNSSSIDQKAQFLLSQNDEFHLFSDGKSAHLQTLLARGLVQNEEYEIAIPLLKRVLITEKSYRDAWILLGMSYYFMEKYDLAKETLETAYNLDPEKTETQYFLALAYEKMNQPDKALTYFTLAMKNGYSPKEEVQKRLADLYVTQSLYDEAVRLYQELLQTAGNSDIMLYVRPIWMYIEKTNNPDEALKLAQKANEAFPDNAMAYNLLGWAYISKGDYRKAEDYLQKAIVKDPNLQAAYYNLGDLFAQESNKIQAQEYYKKAYFMDTKSSIGQLSAQKYNALTE